MKFFTIHLALSLLSISLYAQRAALPSNVATPTAASLGVYGDVGVNFFTGSPNISVSLHELKEGGISVPVDLAYSTSLVKPNLHPGWTGLGWSLGCLSQITRIQHDMPDERTSASNTVFKNAGFFRSSAKLTRGDWYSNAVLKYYSQDKDMSDAYRYELEADEFVFNLPGGYSGRFQWGYDRQWHVFCDVDVKVEFDSTTNISTTGFCKPSEFRKSITDISQLTSGVHYSDRYFNKFTLITPDGTRYAFGGKDATEYSNQFHFQNSSPVVPTTWYLTSILTIYGKHIEYYYHEGPLICSLFRYSTASTTDINDNIPSNDGSQTCSGTSSIIDSPMGFLNFPVYLDSIKSTSQTIVFEHSNSTELRYQEGDIRLNNGDDPYDGNYVFLNKDGNPIDMPLKLQWHKLDRVKIKYANNQLLKQFDFSYTNSATTRLKLLSIQEKDKNGIVRSPYVFTYRPSTFLPYCSERADHWGFNNAYDPTRRWNTPDQYVDLYISSKEPDSTGVYFQSELLSTLQYPTLGYTLFEFEPHTYSKIINKDRLSFTTLSRDKFAGGARIKRISSYANNSATPLVKEYIYRNNYAGQSNISSLPSSGVLGGLHQYVLKNFTGVASDGAKYKYNLFSTGSVLPAASNAQGSHIGYTEVVELVNGKGYTKYTFTNYDTQEGNAYPHMDESAIFNTDGDRTVYAPNSSKVMERGKIKKMETFTTDNKKVKQVDYEYMRSSSSFLRGVEFSNISLCFNLMVFKTNDYIDFVTAYKIYEYAYLLASETQTIYPTDDPGNELKTLVQSTYYEYNLDRKLVKATITKRSDGSRIVAYNAYPFDYTSSTADPLNVNLEMMSSDSVHAINALVKQEILKLDSNGVTTIVGGKISRYGSNYLPMYSYQLESTAPISRDNYVNQDNHPPEGYLTLLPDNLPYKKNEDMLYDGNGNLIQYNKVDNVVTSYVYGYNNTLPVAEVTGASYDQVKNAAIAAGFAINDLNTTSLTDAQLRGKLQLLKSKLPQGTQMIAYTFNPTLGATSATDTNNVTTYFEYDSFGKLQNVRDKDGNIVKNYFYHYGIK